MEKRVFIIAACAALLMSQFVCQAKRQDFEERTVVYKGEHIVGLGINYINANTKNWGIWQIITGMDAKGSILKIAPQYSYAFARNQAVGIRLNYTDIKGGADNLSLDLFGVLKADDVSIDINSRKIGGTAFYRRYFGLDRKGNCGFYMEAGLGYFNTHSVMGDKTANNYTTGHKVHLSLSPGFLVYIVPNASLHMQLGIADLNWNQSTSYKDGVKDGSLSRWNGGVGLRLMDLLFGVTYHF